MVREIKGDVRREGRRGRNEDVETSFVMVFDKKRRRRAR